MKNAINWFEVPCHDIHRAINFYQKILNLKLEAMEMMGMQCAFFPIDDLEKGVGGCLMQGPGYHPSDQGPIIYLNGGSDLSQVLNHVNEAGGKVLLPKTPIGKNGFMAHFLDSEGNKLGLHSAN